MNDDRSACLDQALHDVAVNGFFEIRKEFLRTKRLVSIVVQTPTDATCRKPVYFFLLAGRGEGARIKSRRGRSLPVSDDQKTCRCVRAAQWRCSITSARPWSSSWYSLRFCVARQPCVLRASLTARQQVRSCVVLRVCDGVRRPGWS